MSEKWRPVEEFTGYDVSNEGRVRGWRKGYRGGFMKRPMPIMLSTQKDKDGYPTIRLSDGKRRKKQRVHSLVLKAFVGPRPEGENASHLNGNRMDNRSVNLVWESQKQNIARKKEHGTQQIGENGSSSKLTNKDVRSIRRLDSEGVNFIRLAEMFGVTRQNIGHIVNRSTWTHV